MQNSAFVLRIKLSAKNPARKPSPKPLPQGTQVHYAGKQPAAQKNDVLAIPLNYGYEYIVVNEIEFIEAEKAYCYIHLSNGTSKLVSKNMGYFEDVLLPVDTFIKLHHSYFIIFSLIQTFRKKARQAKLPLKAKRR